MVLNYLYPSIIIFSYQRTQGNAVILKDLVFLWIIIIEITELYSYCQILICIIKLKCSCTYLLYTCTKYYFDVLYCYDDIIIGLHISFMYIYAL